MRPCAPRSRSTSAACLMQPSVDLESLQGQLDCAREVRGCARPARKAELSKECTGVLRAKGVKKNQNRFKKNCHVCLENFTFQLALFTSFHSRQAARLRWGSLPVCDTPRAQPIFRFGIRPSTDGAVRALPRQSCDHVGKPRQGRSYIHTQYRGGISGVLHWGGIPPLSLIGGLRV